MEIRLDGIFFLATSFSSQTHDSEATVESTHTNYFVLIITHYTNKRNMWFSYLSDPSSTGLFFRRSLT